MLKALAFFMGVFILGVYLTGIVDSGGGAVVTQLTAAMSSTDTTITVKSTNNFLDVDYLNIGNEQILYTSKDATHFYLGSVSNRGQNGTTAATHSVGIKAYTKEMSIMNQALNLNISAEKSNTGIFSIVTIPITFLTYTLPNIITFNFPFLQGNMAIVGYLFMAMSVGLVITLALSFLWVAAGLVKLL